MTHLDDRRSEPRVAASGVAWAIAGRCRQVAPGQRLEATLVDVSATSVGISVMASLWQGDLLTLHARLFGCQLDADVVVSSVRRTVSGGTAAGCSFRGLSGDQRVALERILLGRVAQDDLGLSARFALG
ncbi:MAG TPA: PilZ domain-containing protein [Gaiellales bacterium]|jgi:PilZ domain|nr:PilZ domain-containing protein [Gaiellales bacterium]